MHSLNVLFLNCTLKTSPELSNTEALWNLVAPLYQQQGCKIQRQRIADMQILPEATLAAGPGDPFLDVFDRIKQADILVLGTPVVSGMRSSESQKLIERLHGICRTHANPATGQSPLYNKVFGLVLVGDTAGGSPCIAQTCYDFNQLGCINPPNNTVAWFPSLDTHEGFIEANNKYSVTANRDARLLVDHSVALAKLLRQTPLTVNIREATDQAKAIAAQKPPAIATQATAKAATLITPKAIRTEENLMADGIDYHHLTKRIWTMMQAGMQRGFELTILNLEERIFRAARDGKGFIYKIYPGHFSFRRQYQDYDAEQTKSHKLALMEQHGLSVPTAYGLFKHVADIPFDRLSFPLVAKPDSGSLSQNVFPNLRDAAQLKQAAALIEANGDVIKLESHISGDDYRVLIINHQYAGCVQRRPASVLGDGKHTILELFHLRNQEPGRGDRYEAHTTIHQLVFDHTSRQLLHRAGLTLETVLPEGKRVYLQKKITASTGSDYVDCTDPLHPSIIQSCINFSQQFSTLTLGFDLITADISRPLAETGGAFNEYNFLPYVDLHENCNAGQKRPVCRLVWDYIEIHADQIVTAEFDPF